MKNAWKRLGISSAAFAIAIVLAFGAGGATADTSTIEARESCPNPAPWWCEPGDEDSRCPDGKLDWRGCGEKDTET